MKYRKIILIILFLVAVSSSLEVSAYVKYISYFSVFSIDNDTIECVRLSTDNKKKPTITILMGSSPTPIIVQNKKETIIIPINNFDFKSLLTDYHLVILSHPHIPACTSFEEVDEHLNYFSNKLPSNKLQKSYLDDNYLENNINRGLYVIDYLKNQNWVDSSKIILFGHSQGAHVVAHMAMVDQSIFAVGYFSGNPLGRFSSLVAKERDKAKQKLISNNKAQSNINSLYKAWQTICSGELLESPSGDRNKTWKSYSNSYINELCSIKANLFIAYGTDDINAVSCDYLPIFLELNKKNNYSINPFIGRGHNFELIENGKSNFEDMMWQEAINKFKIWIEECSSLRVCLKIL